MHFGFVEDVIICKDIVGFSFQFLFLLLLKQSIRIGFDFVWFQVHKNRSFTNYPSSLNSQTKKTTAASNTLIKPFRLRTEVKLNKTTKHTSVCVCVCECVNIISLDRFLSKIRGKSNSFSFGYA